MEHILICDSQFHYIDNDGIRIEHRTAPIKTPSAKIEDIQILRNYFYDIGLRCSTEQGGKAIGVAGISIADIAGNVITKTAAQGIDVVGGRWGYSVPVIRIQIRYNQVQDTLIHKSDFGGIEFWGIGPAYIYNNLSINPIGWVAHRNVYHKNQAFYLDHGAKVYFFNNIGWSEKGDHYWRGTLGNHFLHEIRNRWNLVFHNTAFAFHQGQSHVSSHGDQQQYLANLFIDCHNGLSHWRLNEAEEIAYAKNIFAGKMNAVYSRWQGETFLSTDDFVAHLKKLHNQLSFSPGWYVNQSPVINPDQHDFRPHDQSPCIDRGVRVFVPWGLARVVGEWNFHFHPKNPTIILAYDSYPQFFHRTHGDLRLTSSIPQNTLLAENVTPENYQQGVLEDWCHSALRFDGNTILRLPHSTLIQDFEVGDKEKLVIPGTKRETVNMDTNNFLIEVVLQADPQSKGSIITEKIDLHAGYSLRINQNGKLEMLIRSNGKEYSVLSQSEICNNIWHHILVEVDRQRDPITIYIDGENQTSSPIGTILSPNCSLNNSSDFLVGKNFRGLIDFLRISRGTLADAQTTIQELISWQFNGPHFYDFSNRLPTGGIRDVGAIEHPTISGIRPITEESLTQPSPTIEGKTTLPNHHDLVKNEDQIAKVLEWGTIFIPKQVSINQSLQIQVILGTETVEKPSSLHLELYAVVESKKIPGYSRAKPIPLIPGSTKPLTLECPLPPYQGITSIIALLYISPDGTYQNKTHSAEISLPVITNLPQHIFQK